MGVELAGNIASVFQQHCIMSIENRKLKQQIMSLQKQKEIKDGKALLSSLCNNSLFLFPVFGRRHHFLSFAEYIKVVDA